MKKFVTRFVLFLLPAIIFLTVAELYVRSIPNTYTFKDQWMWKHGQDIQTLVLGNSHAYYDMNPSVMGDGVFSLANVSQRLEHDLFLLKRYEKACPQLHTVVAVVDNSNLFDIPMEEEEPARLTYYQLYMGYDKHSVCSRYGFELANIFSFWQKVGNHLRKEPLACDSLGWGIAYNTDKRPQDALSPERLSMHNLRSWKDVVPNVQAIFELATWCKEHQLRLIIVQTPVSKMYQEEIPAIQKTYLQFVMNCCRLRYGALIADFSDDGTFIPTDFFDADHLSSQGAEKFSIKMKALLEND